MWLDRYQVSGNVWGIFGPCQRVTKRLLVNFDCLLEDSLLKLVSHWWYQGVRNSLVIPHFLHGNTCHLSCMSSDTWLLTAHLVSAILTILHFCFRETPRVYTLFSRLARASRDCGMEHQKTHGLWDFNVYYLRKNGGQNSTHTPLKTLITFVLMPEVARRRSKALC